MSGTYTTEGIVIKRVNFSEADRILTLFTKHYGKIKAIAKGVRKIKSRKAGGLELFNQVKLFLSRGRNFDIITDVEIIDSFQEFRNNLTFITRAFQIVELVDKLTAERVESQAIFKLLKMALGNLNKKGVVINFEIEILKELGFGLPRDLSRESVKHFIEKIIEKEIFKAGY